MTPLWLRFLIRCLAHLVSNVWQNEVCLKVVVNGDVENARLEQLVGLDESAIISPIATTK